MKNSQKENYNSIWLCESYPMEDFKINYSEAQVLNINHATWKISPALHEGRKETTPGWGTRRSKGQKWDRQATCKDAKRSVRVVWGKVTLRQVKSMDHALIFTGWGKGFALHSKSTRKYWKSYTIPNFLILAVYNCCKKLIYGKNNYNVW